MNQSSKTNPIMTVATLLFAAACGGGGGAGGGADQENIELIAAPDGAVTAMGEPVEILVGNNDVGVAEEVQITRAPQHGALSEEGPVAITYTPDPEFAGHDSFEYRMKVGNSVSEAVSVQLIVTEELVFLDGEGEASSLRYILTDGESALSDSPAFAAMPDDTQGMPSNVEGDLDAAGLFQIDLSQLSDYIVSPDGRWIAAVGSDASPNGGVIKKLMVIDRKTHMRSRVHTASLLSTINKLKFSASGDHLLFCTSNFLSGSSLRMVSLGDGLPVADSSELALPVDYSGRVISYEVSPNAEVCAIRLSNQGGDDLYAIDMNRGAASLLRMTSGHIFQAGDKTCPEYAWLPGGDEDDLQVLVYRSDVSAAEGDFQLFARGMAQGTDAWRIDTDGGHNPGAVVSSFAISPDGKKVAYRKDGEVQGVQAIYVNTTSQLALHDARAILIPGGGSRTVEGYVWCASSKMVYGQIDRGGLFQGPSELHVYAAEVASGIQELVSDAEGIEAGLIALSDGEMSGVLYERNYIVSTPDFNFPLSSVEIWSSETHSTFKSMGGPVINDVQLSHDGARVVIFHAGGKASQVAVAAAFERPLEASASDIMGPGRRASEDSFTFLANSDRWVYLDTNSGNMMLGGVDIAERVISAGRLTSRQITSLPSMNQ